jgi:hypothetical protein
MQVIATVEMGMLHRKRQTGKRITRSVDMKLQITVSRSATGGHSSHGPFWAPSAAIGCWDKSA